MQYTPEMLRRLALMGQYGQGLGAVPPAQQPQVPAEEERAQQAAMQQQSAPVQPAAPQAMSTPEPAKKEGFFARKLRGLGETILPAHEARALGISDTELSEAQRTARKRYGLGLLTSALQGGGGDVHQLNQQGAHVLLQGQQQRSIDNRYNMERDYRLSQDEQQRQDRVDSRAYQQAQDKLAQDNFNRQFEATEKWRSDQIKQDADNKNNGLTENQRILMTDKMRKEYDARKMKVAGGSQNAEIVLQLASNPTVAQDPSAQTSMVFAFGRMLDPESVVRTEEYRLLESSRGLVEEVQALIPRLQTGARLTPQQIQRMAAIAQQFTGKGQERVQALDSQYSELAQRRGIDPFEITGKAAAPNQNTIDVGAIMQGNGATRPQAFYPQGASGAKVVPVDY